jgi:hypothetical protein
MPAKQSETVKASVDLKRRTLMGTKGRKNVKKPKQNKTKKK